MNKYQEALDKIVEKLKLFHSTKRGGGKTYLQGKINILQELVDKETPKNVVKRTMPIIDEVYCCSKCGQHVELTQNYCGKCGQKLDWEIEDE